MCAGDFQLNLQQKRCGMIQDTTFRQIRARHVSTHGLEAQLEQGTDIIEAITHANYKWAQRVAHRGQLAHWSAAQPMGPTNSNLPRGASSLDVKVGSKRHTCRWSSPWPWLPPINMRGGWTHTPHTSPSPSPYLELGDLHPRCFRQPGGVED